MAIRIALNHKTHYTYKQPVWLSPHLVRLRPAPHARTPILSYSLKVTPAQHFVHWQQDPYGNLVARVVFPNKTHEFGLEVDLVAEMTVLNPFDFFVERSADSFPFAYQPMLAQELTPYLEKEALTPSLTKLVGEMRPAGTTSTVQFLVDLNTRLQKRVKYLVRLEEGVQTPEQTLTLGCGSCRDSAWLLVQVLRHLGLAARFVSGYLVQLAADVKPLEGPAGASKDFVDLHAWTEVFIPGAGWIGLDPTGGLLAGEGHIPLAATANPISASPVSGTFSLDVQATTASEPGPSVEARGEGKDSFAYAMTVTRIHEEPRVTKPYTEAQWTQIDALGRQIDAELEHNDVRLTMGGEPTFVSMDDVDAAEWNGAAMGPTKRGLGDQFVRRLRDRLAPGGMIHHGQGKWYPGESLPRWAFGLWWRRDGEPIWNNPALLADESKRYKFTEKDAKEFVEHLADRLALDRSCISAGYEDTWYYLWKERRLPVNVDPFNSELANAEDRARLSRVFELGLDSVVGYALPLRRDRHEDGTGQWVTGPWFFRPERMYLVPGDSPMGYRLPLESIPWVAATDYPFLHELDPWESRGEMEPRPAISAQHYLVETGLPAEHLGMSRRRYVRGAPVPLNPVGYVGQSVGDPAIAGTQLQADGTWAPLPTFGVKAGPERAAATAAGVARSPGTGVGAGAGAGVGVGVGVGGSSGTAGAGGVNGKAGARSGNGSSHRPPGLGQSAASTVRTAMCVEARGGIVYIFMPPVARVEDYLELVAAVEDTAAELAIPVLLEGYTPPNDPRLNGLKVTPDPGVIEINTQPLASWDELVSNTTMLYEEARKLRLGAEKFLIDGRHAGTGGGNHLILGGATPADSPLLRRPDLLKSLIGYWHNHPSLSYLFSGMFVGPTSQAPRVDEARNDQVYELEIAFKQIPEHGDVPPWLVDRIFRNLLIDSTGNTHRAEFCIDKLYSPDSATGRLGLLELRAVEMPPEPQMSLAQQLLLRALVAKFWRQPYRQPLVRWRTQIHDRFMLPHFVWEDLKEIIVDLAESGYPFKPEWFAPHLEFRFPLFGSVSHGGVEVEVRQAIEPWPVLGEEPGAGGTVRFVDSSVERLQVVVRGMTDSRHQIGVNGRELPMHPTGVNGEFVAGVRYRAWQPATCLHPTIKVHSPLVFDVLDRWNGRSIGGCTYHVMHPGGRVFEHRPINAYEAQSRRLARFVKAGHTPGPLVLTPSTPSQDFPLTLDLRR